MFSSRTHVLIVALLLVSLIGLAPAAIGQDVPFKGTVIDEITPIRAGAGRSFYIVGELSGGTEVAIEEMVFGWYKVRPPQGTYSYISRAFVDARGDGKTGEINTHRAAVRAASVNNRLF